ncbi:MAG: ImmA/IrrE family metallo-endopeptidase [Candidatus Eremiobacteraeota bacterium]|nr:ImmA/IrrE family metallo-endopeptidase [Candidatus Eremiobacteraeota bacterium]
MKHMVERGPVFEQILSQLTALKYQPKFVETIVPSWWTPEAEASPNGLEHLKLLLAQYLGLDMAVLLRDGIVKPIAPSGMSFKRSSDLQHVKPPDPNLAYFSRVVKSLAGTIEPSLLIPTSAEALHAEILATTGAKCVTLAAILEYCWSRNIAVVHVDNFPVEKKGLDALVYRVKGRYVVIVARTIDAGAGARASFIIAHELGHIALGHVLENTGIIDDSSDEERHRDAEAAADGFAAEVLSGGRYDRVWRGRAKRADTMAERAETFGKKWNIDPGVLLWRCAFEEALWPNAAAASRYLKALPVPTHQFINDVARKNIDTSRVSEDTLHTIERTLITAA